MVQDGLSPVAHGGRDKGQSARRGFVRDGGVFENVPNELSREIREDERSNVGGRHLWIYKGMIAVRVYVLSLGGIGLYARV